MNYQDKLIELCKADKDIFILTAENRAAIRSFPDEMPKQFADTGIAEQTLIGVSAGMALRGRKPIAHALASFLTLRAFEFIRTDIGIPNLPVKLVGAVPGFLSEANGPTHQAIEDISLMRGIPGMKIFCPSDEQELLDGLEVIMKDSSPWYIRFNSLPPLVQHNSFEIGKAEVLKEPGEITILSYGFMVKEAVEAAELLTEEGYQTGVLNMRTLKPIDNDIILKTASESALVVTLEDHLITGGLFSIVSELFTTKRIAKDVLPLALTTFFRPAMLHDILMYEEFNAPSIAGKIKSYFEMHLGVAKEENYGK